MAISRRSIALLVLSGMIVGARPQLLASQTPSASDGHRHYCERLATTLAAGRNQATYRQAMGNLQSCPEGLATPVLLLQWQQPPQDTSAINALATTTKRFRDQRLLEAVLRIAANVSLPTQMRIATFHTLVAYVDPHTVVIFRQLDRKGLSGSRYVLLGSIDHDNSEAGGMPLRTSASREIIQFFADLGAGDPDSTVRSTAKFLAEQLGTQK